MIPGKGTLFGELVDFRTSPLVDAVLKVERKTRHRGTELTRNGKEGHRVDRDSVDMVEGALRLDIEVTDRFDGVTEELDAQRQIGVRRKQIEDSAAEGQVSGLADQVGSGVSILDEPLESGSNIDLRAGREWMERATKSLREGIRWNSARAGMNSRSTPRGARRPMVRISSGHSERRLDLLIGRQ